MTDKIQFNPHLAGILTQAGVIAFWLIFVILGMIQPGYEPVKNTISVLAIGEFGWIQQLNFVILFLVTMSLGLGLSQVFYGRYLSQLSGLFALNGIGILGLIIFPADLIDSDKIALTSFATWQGAIHFLITIGMGIVSILIGTVIIKNFQKQPKWLQMKTVTIWLISLAIGGGVIWLTGRFMGFSYAWKGLLQKLIVTDVLIWLGLVGHQLAKVDTSRNQK